MQLRTILIPLDGSHHAESALAYAHALAAIGGARLVLVRAVPGVSLMELGNERSLADEAEQYLERIAVDLPVKVGISVFAGDPPAVIARSAWARQADLVVMTMSPRPHFGGYLHGSVAEQLLARTRVPLLIVRPGNAFVRAKKLTQHPCVIVPLDGSAAGEAAIPLAAGLRQTLDGELYLVWASPSTRPLATSGPRRSFSIADRMPARARNYLSLVAGGLTRLYRIPRLHLRVRSGAPALVLARAIHPHSAAFVAVATEAPFDRTRVLLERLAEVVLRGHTAALLLGRAPAVTSAPAGAARLATAA